MIKTLRIFGILSCALTLTLVSGYSVRATNEPDIKYSTISQNCLTIKQSLHQLQKVDSRARTYLGTTYETISNKFITPLNLRLVKNNLPTLSNIQTDFSLSQNQFRESYTNYMRELESLISIDCHEEPERFYEQLLVVRTRRETLRLATNQLTSLANQQYQAVVKLRDSL